MAKASREQSEKIKDALHETLRPFVNSDEFTVGDIIVAVAFTFGRLIALSAVDGKFEEAKDEVLETARKAADLCYKNERTSRTEDDKSSGINSDWTKWMN